MTTVFDSCFATPGKMMPLPEARRILEEQVKAVVGTETLPLRNCTGKILAEDVKSQQTVPPHNNSAMDGYALHFDDLNTDGETKLPVMARIPAGHTLGRAAVRGETYRIFTGAPIPLGCDTVVMQENAVEEKGFVTFQKGAAAKRGVNFRKAGEDIKVGDTLFTKGRKLRAADIGVAASLGRSELNVYAPLKVAVFSTGDEIKDAGAPLPEGCVYDSNRYSVMSMLESLGCTVTDLGILPDDLDIITKSLDSAADNHDMIFTSGGVSLGEEDHVKAAVSALGRINFWRIAIKPGRPIALGEIKGKSFIGLPGNPVATMVTFMTIARPLILGLSGCRDISTPSYKIPAGFTYDHAGGRYEWQRAYLKRTPDGLVVELFHTTGSGILTSMTLTDGLLEISDEKRHIEPGDLVDFIPYSEVSR
jgi:molybdopterin molybdotransferase